MQSHQHFRHNESKGSDQTVRMRRMVSAFLLAYSITNVTRIIFENDIAKYVDKAGVIGALKV